MNDFLYDNILGSDFELMPCRFDSSGGIETVDMGSQMSNSFVKIIGTDEQIIVNKEYSSTLSISFQVCKRNCREGFKEITPDEYSKINRWLNRKESHPLKFIQEGYENLYFLGTFNIQALKLNDKIYGLNLTFFSNYPYGFLDEITAHYTGNYFTLYDYSDEEGELFPFVVIQCLEDGDLQITNDMDNELFLLKNCKQHEILHIDNKNHLITSSNELHNQNLYNDYNFNYIKICNRYNNRANNYSSSLNIDISFQYSPIRKVGV